MARKARDLRQLRRRQPRRTPYARVLIVCEGSKTEPNYFRELRDDLKLNTAYIEVDGDSASSPRSVVTHAQRRYRADREFDRVYCIFDKDHHTTYEEAKSAIDRARPPGVFYAITSIPCFEFWLLLHFIMTTKPFAQLGERSPADCVIDELKKHLRNYTKGQQKIYTQVKEETDKAMRHAEQANRQAEQNGTDNPSTLIPTLIQYLRNLRSIAKSS